MKTTLTPSLPLKTSLGWGGADPNLQLDTLGASSPLYWAATHGMREVVEMILQGGVDLQAELLINESWGVGLWRPGP